VLRITGREWIDSGRSAAAAADLAEEVDALLVVDVDGPLPPSEPSLRPFVTVAVAPDAADAAGAAGAAAAGLEAFDLVLSDAVPGVADVSSLDLITAAVGAHPQAALVAAQVMRSSVELDIASALVSESAAYSMLQAGSEFGAWLATRPASDRRGEQESQPVVVTRVDGELRIVLNRPAVHNAYNRAMRDGLVEALQLAAADSSLQQVVLAGAGRSFCSGGDLTEFGTTPDPVTAHVVRSTRSAPWWASRVATKLRAELHGASIGAGIELAAWAADVVASEDTYVALPEVGLGLIPGAGGTVSLPRRIGRQRSVYLAVTGARLDASAALAWGVVDRVNGSTRRR